MSSEIANIIDESTDFINRVNHKIQCIRKSRVNILLDVLHYMNVILHKFQPISFITMIILLCNTDCWYNISYLCCFYIVLTPIVLITYGSCDLGFHIGIEEALIPIKRGNIQDILYFTVTLISLLWDMFSVITLSRLHTLIGG